MYTRLDLKPDCLVAKRTCPWDISREVYNECSTIQMISGTTSVGTAVRRRQKYFQTDGLYFCPDWKERYPRWDAHPYPEWLDLLQQKLEILCSDMLARSISFNSALLTEYRDGSDVIRHHRDDLAVWGENPVIASYSTGATRTIQFSELLFNPEKPRSMKPSGRYISLDLCDGDVMVMAGKTQRFYTHCIPRVENAGKRYSITFRQVIKTTS